MALQSLAVVVMVISCMKLASAQGTCQGVNSCVYDNIAIRGTTNSLPNTHYYIGGLFGVHELAPDSYSCSDAAYRDRGMVNLEAFMWAIKEYRPANSVVSIGGIALDTCSRPEQTIENILSFETCKVSFGNVNPPTPRNLLVYIGPDTSSDAMSSAMMLKDMNKTQISHAATSPELSNMGMYPFFLRTVPSDIYNSKIMASLLTRLNTRYVLAVYVEDSHGMGGYNAFKTEAATENICIVHNVHVPTNPTSAQLDAMTTALADRKTVRYIVMFSTSAQSRMLLEAINARRPTDFRNFIFIGTSSWTSAVVDNLDVSAYHAGLSVPSSFATDTQRFYAYLNTLQVNSNSWDQKWFRGWRDSKYGCTNTNPCTDTQTLAGKYSEDPYVPFTLAAVKAAIDGIQAGARASCNTTDLCSSFLNLDNRGQKIYDGIVNAQRGADRYFNNVGDASAAFTDYTVYKVDGGAGQPTASVKVHYFPKKNK